MGLRVLEMPTPGLILNLCTAIGAWGGFPDPPPFFTAAVNKFPLLKWVLLTVLIYQGGGEQDFQLAVEITVAIYIMI